MVMEHMNVYQCIDQNQFYGKKFQRHILRRILISKIRTFNRSLTQQSNGDVIYDGNVYTSNYRNWFQGCYYNNKPHFTKTYINRPKDGKRWRIKDSLIYQTSAAHCNDSRGLENNQYTESLFVLTSDSYLVRYLVNKDRFIEAENIYLGDKFKFEHLSYDCIFDKLIVKSQLFNSSSSIVFYFAIFNAAPLKFIGVMPIHREIFPKTTNSYISSGMLTVITSTKIYSLYNMDSLIKDCMKDNYYLDDFLDANETRTAFNLENSTSTVGRFPYGLPINIDIKKENIDSYKVYSCHAERVNFGGFPWQCLVILQKNMDRSYIYDISNGSISARICEDSLLSDPIREKHPFFHVDNSGRILKLNHDNLVICEDSLLSDPIREKHPFFHVDNSGRILKLNHDNLVCYKIGEQRTENPDNNLVECFSIKFSRDVPTLDSGATFLSRYGRQVTQRYKLEYTLKSEVIHAIDYDEELDILIVLYTGKNQQRSTSDVYMVGLYDNQCGDELRRLSLDKEVSDSDDDEWTIYFVDLLLICILKSITSKGRTVSYMYSLEEEFGKRK